MFGVVLWSDAQEKKAVIWCEDHGDLAFYRQSGDSVDVTLDAGDWVQFDLTTERHLRFAHNPRLISEGLCEGLSDVLESAAPGAEPTVPRGHGVVAVHPRDSAEIIPFAASRASQRAGPTAATAWRA